MYHWYHPEVPFYLRGTPLFDSPPRSLPALLTAAVHLLDNRPDEVLKLALLMQEVEYVGALGTILTWLQQKPCLETHSSYDLKSLPWYCIAANLCKIVCYAAESEAFGAARSCNAKVVCYRQLDGVRGKHVCLGRGGCIVAYCNALTIWGKYVAVWLGDQER